MKTLNVVALVLVALVAVSCKKKEAADDGPKAAGSTKDVTSDRSMQVMNYYVDFFNEVIRDAPAPLKNYFRRSGDAGLSVETMTKWGNVVCGPGWMKMKRDGASKKLEAAKKASSGEFAKLPPLGDAMLEKGVALNEARDQLCKYVKSGDFNKDSGAKAAEYHQAIVAANGAWRAAVGNLAGELDRIEDAQSLSELEKFAADKGQSYWYRFASIRTNQFLREVRRDAAKVDEALPALEEALGGIDEFAKAQGDKLHKSFAGYMKQIDRMNKAIAKLKKSLAAAKSPEEKQEVVEKQFGDLVSTYNTMVSLYNTLISAEGRGELK